MTNKEFIRTITPIIQKVAKERGYATCAAVIAQACLESNYGRSSLGSKYHNYFGMKCGSAWKGKSVNLQTKEEYTPGVLTTIKDNFRVYDSMEDGVYGYFDFIATTRYTALKSCKDAKSYAETIKACGYATSSKYVNSLMKVVSTYDLEQYDGGLVTPVLQTPQTPIAPEDPITQIANEVIAGKWGNGLARKQALTRAGYSYKVVQDRVNQIIRSYSKVKIGG